MKILVDKGDALFVGRLAAHAITRMVEKGTHRSTTNGAILRRNRFMMAVLAGTKTRATKKAKS